MSEAQNLVVLPVSTTIHYDEMCRAIEAAYAVDEVKDIRDKAMALEVYARQAMNVEAERQACEIRLRAERRCGQMLREREMAKAGRPTGNPSHAASNSRGAETLADLGISHTQSSRWQQLAAVPEEQFVQALASPERRSPVDDRALWLFVATTGELTKGNSPTPTPSSSCAACSIRTTRCRSTRRAC